MSDKQESNGPLPLSGLEVVDLSSGPAAGLATMILADFGARVVRYPDPGFQYLNEMPSARMWLRGKAEGQSLAADLRMADVVVVSEPNGFEVREDALRATNPALIYAQVSGAGPDSNLPPYEPVIAAKTGRMKNMAGIIAGAGPHFAAVPVATHATAQNLVAGILAALYQRRRCGSGQKVTTSLLQGLMPYDQGQSLMLQVQPDRVLPDTSGLMPTLNYHPVQCADGRWLQLGNLLPHLFLNFMRVVGLEDLLGGLPETTESVRDRILQTMQEKTRDEWMTLFVADGGVAAHPYLTATETLTDADMTANGHVVVLDGVVQLGPMATLTGTPAKVTAQAKPAGGFDWRADANVPAESPTARPLEGVVVLELATIIASPLGASFLADMGARVIKVEAIGGDPFRHMMGGIGATRCNQGKESISVDLKSEAGQRIVRELAQRADILIHNYRPGVPERLGIGYADLARINPRLVYLSANGYGPEGPGALRPSTHPIPGAAMGGAEYQAGGTPDALLNVPGLREAARRLMRANEVNPDPNTAVVVCAASLLGLTAREVTGRGQQIFLDMFAANAYANFDDLVDYPGKPGRPSLGEWLRGPGPLCRLYEARDGWVFLEIRTEEEWKKFVSLSGFESSDGPVADPLAVPFADTDEAALGNALEALFLSRSAIDWETLCVPAGLGCVQADAVTTGEFFAGPGANRWMVPVEHPELGSYLRHGPMVDFSGARTDLRAGVRAGVDGAALLAELGYPEEQIAALFSEGVLYTAEAER